MALKKYCRKEWDIAHAYGIKSVTPDIATSYFWHCGIPCCEHYASTNELKNVNNCKFLGEAIGAATTAVVITKIQKK